MQISKALKRSTRGSIHFRRRLSIILVLALLVVAIALVAFRGFSEFSVAGGTDTGSDTTLPATGEVTGSSTSSNDEGSYSIMSTDPTPTPTSTPPGPTPTPTYPPEPTPIPLEPVPEFEIGGGAVALLICFSAFGLFMKRGSKKTVHA